MATLARRGGLILVLCGAGLLAGCAGTANGGRNARYSANASGGSGNDIPVYNSAGSGQAELKTASDQSSAQKRSTIRLQLAAGYYQRGQLEVALDEIKKAIDADPNNAAAYGVRGLIYMDMGEKGLAEDNFQRGLKLAPNNADLSNNYGSFLCQNGRGKEAMAYFESALNSRSYQSPEKALNNAGGCAVTLKDYATAERYLSEAVKMTPDLPSTNANLARVYYAQQDYEKAGGYLAKLNKLAKVETYTADMLWLAIKVQHKLGDTGAEAGLVTQLRRHYASSPEYAAFQRGAFDE